jgi:hypothetical protein
MTTPRTARRTTTSTIVNLVAVAALMIGGADVARAQSGTAQISGVVRDQQGGVLPGVTVVLRNQDTGVARTAVSEADGRYHLRRVCIRSAPSSPASRPSRSAISRSPSVSS